MLNAIVESSIWTNLSPSQKFPSRNERANNISPLEVCDFEHSLIVDPLVIKLCLLDFSIWKGSCQKIWIRIVEIVSALVSPMNCKFHRINLQQLQSENTIKSCLLRWRDDFETWPQAVLLRIIALMNLCTACAPDAANGMRNLMNFLTINYDIQAVQV